MGRLGHVMMLFAGASLLAACEQKPRAEDADIQAQLDLAAEQGLLIQGFQDVQGIQRAVDNHLDTLNERNAKGLDSLGEAVDAGAARAMREMADLSRYLGLAINRIEFVPGLSGQPETGPDDLIRGLTPGADWGGAPGGDFAAGFPAWTSLAGQDGPRTVTTSRDPSGRTSTRTVVKFGSGYTADQHNSDGTHEHYYREYQPNGSARSEHTRYDAEGNRTYYQSVVLDSDRGVAVTTTQQGEEEPQSRVETTAEFWERTRKEREQSQREESGADGGTEGGGEGSDPNGESAEGDIDKYQPSDGNGGGTFCPLTLDICRRALDNALASLGKVKVGVILINPGEPAEAPDAPRLVYDTGGLAINPDPNAASGSANASQKQFRMRLPVLVLPPKPGT